MTVWRSFWINIHMAIDLHTSSWVHYKFHLPQVGRSPDVSSDNFDWRQVHLSTKRNICVAPFKLRVTKMDTFAQSQLNCASCTPAQAWSFHDLCSGSNPGRTRTNALAWVHIHTWRYTTLQTSDSLAHRNGHKVFFSIEDFLVQLKLSMQAP